MSQARVAASVYLLLLALCFAIGVWWWSAAGLVLLLWAIPIASIVAGYVVGRWYAVALPLAALPLGLAFASAEEPPPPDWPHPGWMWIWAAYSLSFYGGGGALAGVGLAKIMAYVRRRSPASEAAPAGAARWVIWLPSIFGLVVLAGAPLLVLVYAARAL